MTRLMPWPLSLLLLVVFWCGVVVGQDQADRDQVQPTREAIQTKLDETRISFKVVDRPLEEVTALLAEKYDLRIRIDERALDDVGLTTDSPVILQVENIRLQALFQLMLESLYLTYRIDRHGLEITTSDAAKADMGPPRFYPVGDLVYDNQHELDADSLIKLIYSTLQPKSWDDLGGPGTLTFYGDGLVVSQTDAIHRQLGQFLRGLRMARQRKQDDPLEPITVEYIPSEFEAVIQRVREREIDLPEAEYPLNELAEAIATATELTVWLKDRALDDIGVATDVPITGSWKNASVEQVLADLKQANLTWKVRDGILIITTPQSAKSELLVRIYPVPDLVSGAGDWAQSELNRWHVDAVAASRVGDAPTEGPPKLDNAYKTLGEMLENSIDPDQWEMMGGPGMHASYPPAQCLVVAQTRPIHDKIEHLLAEIRANQRRLAEQVETESEERKNQSPMVVRNHFILRISDKREREDLETVRQRIMTTIEPQAWENEEAYIDLYEGRIVVCQRADIQDLIKTYLQAAGFQGQHYPGSLYKGGGMGGQM